MFSKNFKRYLFVIVICFIGILLVLSTTLLNEQAHDDAGHASILSSPKLLSAFTLTDHNGKPFTEHNLAGKWTFLFAGYTNCPDICPPTMMTFKLASQELQRRGVNGTQFVLLTVDPERDTPEQLSDYLSKFNSGIIGLTGSMEIINSLTHQLGLFHMSDHSNHNVDHSGNVLLLSPKGKLYAIFSSPIESDQLVQTLIKINSSE